MIQIFFKLAREENLIIDIGVCWWTDVNQSLPQFWGPGKYLGFLSTCSSKLLKQYSVARFNFFCHRMDLFLVSSCVPELYVFLKMEQRIERRNRAF